MPLGTLTAQTIDFEPRKPGVYQRAGLGLGAPTDEFRVSAASNVSAGKNLSMSVTRIRQKDVQTGSTIVRKNAVVTVNFQLPGDGSFTADEADNLLVDINEAITAARLSRMASGEN